MSTEKLKMQINILENRLKMIFPDPVTGKLPSKHYALEGKIKQLKVKLENAKRYEHLAR